MVAKQIIWAILDCRPIKKVTGYALGTCLMGIAFGIFVAVRLPNLGTTTFHVITGVCFVVGAAIANTFYYLLKHHYQVVDIRRFDIVEKSTPTETAH